MSRPDWVKCIRQTHEERKTKSWCDRILYYSDEWAFIDIDHAVHSAQQGDRLVPCPECVTAIVAALIPEETDDMTKIDDMTDEVDDLLIRIGIVERTLGPRPFWGKGARPIIDEIQNRIDDIERKANRVDTVLADEQDWDNSIEDRIATLEEKDGEQLTYSFIPEHYSIRGAQIRELYEWMLDDESIAGRSKMRTLWPWLEKENS